jgi:hypothetical protein
MKKTNEIHNEIFSNTKCSNHPNLPFAFYCFDDKTFLCQKCFKLHKKHNIEIINDLKEKSEFYSRTINTENFSYIDQYNEHKKALLNIRNIIDEKINEIEKIIKKLSEENNITPEQNDLIDKKNKTLFDLSYNEYVKLIDILDLSEEIKIISTKIENLSNNMKLSRYNNLHYISNEVKVINQSITHDGYGTNILLGKENGPYFLTEGNKNHYIVFDLGKKYYLKGIKITLHDFECTLKNFKISVMDDNNNWKIISSFVCQPFNKEDNFQYFDIDIDTQMVKMDLIDNWGNGGGNYILIKRLYFEVGDLKNK